LGSFLSSNTRQRLRKIAAAVLGKSGPFGVIDQQRVGKLIKMAVELGHSTDPDLEVGICGEHGSEPSPVEFCYRVGMDKERSPSFSTRLERIQALRLSSFQSLRRRKLHLLTETGPEARWKMRRPGRKKGADLNPPHAAERSLSKMDVNLEAVLLVWGEVMRV
jgi:hypothetical protein